MGNTTHFSTKERILGAAEELFAQHGFAGTSLRQVTSRADVNIAAVNYHFGSKENLVNEVFRRRMDDMTAARLSLLEKALAQRPGQLEPILAAFVSPPSPWPRTAMVAVPSSGSSPAPTPRRTTGCASSCPTTTGTCCASSARPLPAACRA